MIKLFGKYRYHWQPLLSWFIIYWSIAITIIFISGSLLFEQTKVPSLFFFLIIIFVIIFSLGFHRYFVINEDGTLRIATVNPFIPSKIKIADISKIDITKHTLTLYYSRFNKKRSVYMRKWPKKYFLDALAVNEHFKGEVELLDNQDKFDYFTFYVENEKATK